MHEDYPPSINVLLLLLVLFLLVVNVLLKGKIPVFFAERACICFLVV